MELRLGDFAFKKSKSLHLLSALDMLVSEDFPAQTALSSRQEDFGEGSGLSADTQADSHQPHTSPPSTHNELFTMHLFLSTWWHLYPERPFFPALLEELRFIVQCLT